MQQFNKTPDKIVQGEHKKIHCFTSPDGGTNIDWNVVEGFGEEWTKFHNFTDEHIEKSGRTYFDIVPDAIMKDAYLLDVGCGTGRWSKFMASRVKFIEAVDPSKAIFAADVVLKNSDNVRLSMAASDNIPFDDNTFDIVMSIGVLHHIPDTQQAMLDCVKKVKEGGYFYTYLYYDLEGRGFIFKSIFKVVDVLRKFVSTRSSGFKKFLCDVIAVCVYMPVVVFGRILKKIGLAQIAEKLPLSAYQVKSFYVIRTDALDRFGTTLEQRFSKQEVIDMMTQCGLTNIVVGDKIPFWHAIGQKMNKS